MIRNRFQIVLVAAALILFAAPPVHAERTDEAADGVVIRDGATVVTLDDLRFIIEHIIPPAERAQLVGSRKRIERFAGNYFVVRKLAAEAEARELTPEEQRRVEYARTRALNQVQLDHLVETAPQPDFEALAKENYRASPERYRTPAQVRAEHILVSTDERSAEEAEARAREVMERLDSPDADFAALAREYSDDPSVERNDGDLGFFGPGSMVRPFEEAAFALEAPGDVAGPVRTRFGYHVIRLVDTRPEGVRPFEEVRRGIINSLRSEFRSRVVNDTIARIGTMEGVDTNHELLMTLHRPMESLSREGEGPGQ